MPQPSHQPEPGPLDRFALEVFSELREELVARRAHEVKVLLRMSILAGLEMELTPTLNLICDLAGEMLTFKGCAVYFWEQDTELMHLRVSRNLPAPDAWSNARANVLNYWAAKLARPLLLARHRQPEAEALLRELDAASLLIVPLFVRHQVLGSLHLFGEHPDSFSAEDAQLLWMLSLIAECMLSRDASNESLLQFAFNDFLTGLKTRGFFEQQLDLELARAERRGTPVALLMIDIDHFKLLNDRYGHQAGDIVLRDVAAVLARDLREIDTAARYGGEEFILMLPETDLPGARLVAQRLRYAVEQSRFFTGGEDDEPKRVTISIGVAMFPEEARGKRELIEASDAALYHAKAMGRNRVVFYAEMKNRKQAS